MVPESRNRNNTKVHNAGPVSITTFSQKEPENLGFLKKFLDWIARGADKSNIRGTSCPS